MAFLRQASITRAPQGKGGIPGIDDANSRDVLSLRGQLLFQRLVDGHVAGEQCERVGVAGVAHLPPRTHRVPRRAPSSVASPTGSGEKRNPAMPENDVLRSRMSAKLG